MDTTILCSTYLDQYQSGYQDLVQEGWHQISSELPEGQPLERMGRLYLDIALEVETAVQDGNRPVVLAGDCCTTIGTMAGLQRTGLNPTLVWLDAHGDFNTWDTSTSGFLGGMPLAMLVGRGEQTLLEATGCRPILEERVILCDARDLDPEESMALARSRIQHLTSLELLATKVAMLDGPIYVHFDCDILDSSVAAAVNYPAPNGPSLAEMEHLLQLLGNTGRVVAASVSMWEPALDKSEATRTAVMSCVREMLAP